MEGKWWKNVKTILCSLFLSIPFFLLFCRFLIYLYSHINGRSKNSTLEWAVSSIEPKACQTAAPAGLLQNWFLLSSHSKAVHLQYNTVQCLCYSVSNAMYRPEPCVIVKLKCIRYGNILVLVKLTFRL